MQAGSDGNMPFELLPITAQALGRSKLQVWLGSAQGWSLPVSLNRTLPQVSLGLLCSLFAADQVQLYKLSNFYQPLCQAMMLHSFLFAPLQSVILHHFVQKKAAKNS